MQTKHLCFMVDRAGKTSLVAWVAGMAIQKGFQVVLHFLGTTPQSFDMVSLLKSICNQLHELLADIGSDVDIKQYELLESETHMQLSELLRVQLEKLSEKGVVCA